MAYDTTGCGLSFHLGARVELFLIIFLTKKIQLYQRVNSGIWNSIVSSTCGAAGVFALTISRVFGPMVARARKASCFGNLVNPQRLLRHGQFGRAWFGVRKIEYQ